MVLLFLASFSAGQFSYSDEERWDFREF